MKVYHASYYNSYGYGAFDEIDLIVIAESLHDAFNMVLEANERTNKDCWDVKEISLNHPTIKLIHERSV